MLKLRPDRVAAVLGVGRPAGGDERHPHPAGLRGLRPPALTSRWTVPSFRADLAREIDLIEEVARVYGLDRIPSTLPPRRVGRGGLNRAQTARRTVEDLLTGAGLTQVINYSFGDDRWPGPAPAGRRRRAAPHGDRGEPAEPGSGLHAHHAAARAARDRPAERVGA